MNVHQLIAEVKQRRPLWDRNHELRHERTLIEALWDEVAVVVGQTQRIVKNKWKTLKDAFRKEAKKTINDLNYHPHWCYYKPLLFLYDQLRIDNATDPLNEQSSSNSALDAENKIEFVYEDIQMPVENGTDVAGTSRKRKFDETSTDHMDNSEYQHRNMNEDEDLCFFKSLVPHVKQLSPQKKMLMRIKIQEMVYKEKSLPGRTSTPVSAHDSSSTTYPEAKCVEHIKEETADTHTSARDDVKFGRHFKIFFFLRGCLSCLMPGMFAASFFTSPSRIPKKRLWSVHKMLAVVLRAAMWMDLTPMHAQRDGGVLVQCTAKSHKYKPVSSGHRKSVQFVPMQSVAGHNYF
ncbi:uncharacterized protein CBL_05638 [Carabus blaptoides fortunei]